MFVAERHVSLGVKRLAGKLLARERTVSAGAPAHRDTAGEPQLGVGVGDDLRATLAERLVGAGLLGVPVGVEQRRYAACVGGLQGCFQQLLRVLFEAAVD